MRLKRLFAPLRYRISGLPVAIRNRRPPQSQRPSDRLRHVYARRYWSVRSPREAAELAAAILILPIFILGTAAWQSWASGRGFARSSGRSALLQFFDQLRLYAASGVLPASYYIYSLQERPTAEHALSFLKRSETKGLLYALVRLRHRPQSSLNNKAAFAKRCAAAGLPVIAPLESIPRGGAVAELPDSDLFLKPLKGKGGRGAERWLREADGHYRSSEGARSDRAGLRAHIESRAEKEALLIQPLIRNHESLAELNCGVLSTARVLTCLDPAGVPEVMGAALRMAIDPASAVDNLHSGGIAAGIEVDSGRLLPATNLGRDSRVGWVERHPATGARIAGLKLEWWGLVQALAIRAHRVFNDRLFVGWDIAMTPEGPVIVEANGSPDLDILQRCYRRGMADSRFAELLAGRLAGAEADARP